MFPNEKVFSVEAQEEQPNVFVTCSVTSTVTIFTAFLLRLLVLEWQRVTPLMVMSLYVKPQLNYLERKPPLSLPMEKCPVSPFCLPPRCCQKQSWLMTSANLPPLWPSTHITRFSNETSFFFFFLSFTGGWLLLTCVTPLKGRSSHWDYFHHGKIIKLESITKISQIGWTLISLKCKENSIWSKLWKF